MANLASVADAERLGYTLPPDLAEALLARASARLRRAAGQQISRTETTIRLRADSRGLVRLPAPPVVEVAAVVAAVEDGGAELDGWVWDGRDRVCGLTGDVVVTYTHGLDPIPDELLDLVCQVAARLAQEPDSGGMAAGVRSESIDDYSVTYAQEALDVAAGLLGGEEAALRAVLGAPASADTVTVR